MKEHVSLRGSLGWENIETGCNDEFNAATYKSPHSVFLFCTDAQILLLSDRVRVGVVSFLP